MGTQNCMMSGCCGGKTHSPGVRDLNSNHTSGLAALCLAALCPCPSPHPGPSSKHLRSPSLPQGAVRQMYRVSQDLGTQHAHSVTPELLVTLPASCLHLLTTRSSCEPWSHPEDLSGNSAQPFRGIAASENSLGFLGPP